MKFASIYLSNYIGIYNGMGLYEIHIDMTKCKNRITIIRGDNGSGKSTLSKAMNLFPDESDAFIPGLPARKEIVLVDGETLYKLSFIHGVNNKGDRQVTKAYITKTFGGRIVELNENGNVTSYKDILYNELGLDANFSALSQLSNDDRGLADKRPAERKRFVNSIISSLETYNNIYKTLTKRSANYKSMINAVVAKLNILGDEESLVSNLNALETKINHLQDQKDQAVAALANAQSTISILDPDGSIQNTNTTIIAEMELAEKEVNKIQSIIDGLITSNSIDSSVLERMYKSVVDKKNSFIIQNQIARKEIEGLILQKEKEAEALDEKVRKLSTLQSGYNYELLKSKISDYKKELEDIAQELTSIGIDNIAQLSKEEYILALETLKDLEEYISSFKSSTDFSIIEKIVSHYIETGEIPERIDLKPYREHIDMLNANIEEYRREKAILESKLGLLDRLSMRPSECKVDSCHFIQEALVFANGNPKDRISTIDAIIYEMTKRSNWMRRL